MEGANELIRKLQRLGNSQQAAQMVLGGVHQGAKLVQ